MVFAGFNILAVLAAMIASMAFGAFWYSTFAKPWMAAAKLTEEDIQPVDANGQKLKQSPLPYIIAAACQLTIAIMMAGIIGHMGDVSLTTGIITAIFVWLGFTLPTMIVNHRFQMQSWSLTVIDASHWLCVFILQGAIIGAIGL